MRKRMISSMVTVLGVAALTLAGCGGAKQPDSSPVPGPVPSSAVELPASGNVEAPPIENPGKDLMTGGWQVQNEVLATSLTEESEAAFRKAMEEFKEQEMEPVALLATQPVAGMNYLYLCTGENHNVEPEPTWFMATVYQDLSGNCSIGSVEEIDPVNLPVSGWEMSPQLTGSWQVVAPAAEISALPEETMEAFVQAAEGYPNLTLTPLAVLATQVVSGTNSKILCHGTETGEEPMEGIFSVTLYRDLNGHSQLIDVQPVDLTALF